MNKNEIPNIFYLSTSYYDFINPYRTLWHLMAQPQTLES